MRNALLAFLNLRFMLRACGVKLQDYARAFYWAFSVLVAISAGLPLTIIKGIL